MFLKIFILSSVMAFFANCELPEPESYRNKLVEAPVESDENGVLTASVSSASTDTLSIAASSSSSISTASMSIPPGTFVIDTQVTIEEGSSLADSAVTTELGLSEDTAVENAAPAVNISASGNVQAENPFSLALPLPAVSGLWLFSSPWDNLAVIYKVKNLETGKVYKGLFTLANLSINENNGTVNVKTKFFGSYQAVVFNKPIETAVEKESTTPILAKSQEAALPTVTLTSTSASIDDATRLLSADTSGDATDKITSCYAFLDADKNAPYDYNEATTAPLKHQFQVLATHSGDYYARFTCYDEYGRTIESPWSDAVTVKDSMSVSTLAKVFSMAVAVAADIPTCGADNIGQLVYVESDQNFQTCKTTGWATINVTGPTGATGATGATGPQGPQGDPGSAANAKKWYWIDANNTTIGEMSPSDVNHVFVTGNDNNKYIFYIDNTNNVVKGISSWAQFYSSELSCPGIFANNYTTEFPASSAPANMLSISGVTPIYDDNYGNTFYYTTKEESIPYSSNIYLSYGSCSSWTYTVNPPYWKIKFFDKASIYDPSTLTGPFQLKEMTEAEAYP